MLYKSIFPYLFYWPSKSVWSIISVVYVCLSVRR